MSGTATLFVIFGVLLLAFAVFELIVVLQRRSGRLAAQAWPSSLFNWRGVVLGGGFATVCFISAVLH